MIEPPTWVKRLPQRLRSDRGNAIVEFVFLGLIMLVPLVYLVVAVTSVQRNTFAVTQAARQAGRAYVLSQGNPAAARYAAQLSIQGQGVEDAAIAITYGPRGGGCGGATGFPPLEPGGEFTICVSRHITIPAVPTWIGARNNTVTGKFLVRVDQYIEKS